MTWTVGGIAVPDGGAAVVLSTAEPLVVAGSGIQAVCVEGWESHPFEDTGDGWAPPPQLRHRLETAGRLTLAIATVEGDRRIPVDREPVKLSPDELAVLLADLGELSLSFEDPDIYGELWSAASSESRAARTRDERMQALADALGLHLPPLLARPLRTLAFESGPVPVSRARPSPRTLIERKLHPERTHVLGIAAVEKPSEVDYRWLRVVTEATATYAARRVRAYGDIRDQARPERDPWRAHLDHLRAALGHQALRSVPRGRATEPTWSLTRSVHGGAIYRAVEDAEVRERIHAARDWTPGIENLSLFPVADHSHLYELWVFFSLVEILRARFGFRFVDPEPQWVADYVRYVPEARGWQFTRPVELALTTTALDGETPIRMRATLRHEPRLDARKASHLTPDVHLVLEGGEDGRERRTVHVLDAKYSVTDPLTHARDTARRKYLEDLAERPTTSFVALPSPDAGTRALMTRIDQLQRTRGDWRGERASLAVQATGRHGLAWGAVDARPGPDGSLGLRQFLTLALHYHRSELRHLCGQCGHVLTLDDLHVRPAGATRYTSASTDERKLAAHGDGGLGAWDTPSADELVYGCPDCGHEWRRHACRTGHVLLKYGALTPHRRLDDADGNVVCSVCGHYLRGRCW